MKHMCIALALEACEGPNTVLAECLMALSGHHLEIMMATCHQPGIAGEAAETVFFPEALEEIRGETSPTRPQQCVHDG